VACTKYGELQIPSLTHSFQGRLGFPAEMTTDS
jgi:hypothetical protein